MQAKYDPEADEHFSEKKTAVLVWVKEGRQVEFPFGWFIWEGYRKHSVG